MVRQALVWIQLDSRTQAQIPSGVTMLLRSKPGIVQKIPSLITSLHISTPVMILKEILGQ